MNIIMALLAGVLVVYLYGAYVAVKFVAAVLSGPYID